MAIMRTNRLMSKTTTPPQRRFAKASELEAQDAAYKKYQGDVEIYNSQMKEYKKPEERKYSNFVGGKSGMRTLSKNEESAFNAQLKRDNPASNTYTNVEVVKGAKDITTAFHGNMVKPIAPKRVDPGNWSNVELNAMPTKKATITSKKGKLRQSAPADKPVFDAPMSASKMGHKNAMGTKGAEYGDLKRAKAGVVKTTSAGLNREKAQFEAFAKSGGDQTKSMFKAEAQQSRKVGKQYKAEGNREGVQMMKQEAKQYKKAAQFAGKLSKGTNKYYERNMVSKYNASR